MRTKKRSATFGVTIVELFDVSSLALFKEIFGKKFRRIFRILSLPLKRDAETSHIGMR